MNAFGFRWSHYSYAVQLDLMGNSYHVSFPSFFALQLWNLLSTSGVIWRFIELAAVTNAPNGTCSREMISGQPLHISMNGQSGIHTCEACISFCIVNNAASWQRAVISAPEQPSVCKYQLIIQLLRESRIRGKFAVLTMRAISRTSRSGSTLIALVRIFNISSRASWSGGPTYKMRSSRPGRIRAESYTIISCPPNPMKGNTHDDVWPIGSSYDRDTQKLLNTIHFVQKTCKHPAMWSSTKIGIPGCSRGC